MLKSKLSFAMKAALNRLEQIEEYDQNDRVLQKSLSELDDDRVLHYEEDSELSEIERLQEQVKQLTSALQQSYQEQLVLRKKLRTKDDLQTEEDIEEFKVQFREFLDSLHGGDINQTYGYMRNTYTPQKLKSLNQHSPKTVKVMRKVFLEFCQTNSLDSIKIWETGVTL